MDSAVAVIDWRQNIDALYRADADRLWRAVYAYAARRTTHAFGRWPDDEELTAARAAARGPADHARRGVAHVMMAT